MSNSNMLNQSGFAEPSAEPPSSQTAPSDCEIFISYRLDPDQQLAIALKKQLELSVDPVPRVFVSGFRGLQPSAIPWDAQLQRAVQSAKAIIGIITRDSKQREWILFEAGAAWGRGITYVPLLVDTDSSDVPSTISSYLATKADDSTQVETLLEALAKLLGAKVKRPLRLQQLKSAIRTYRGLDTTERDNALEAGSGDLEKEIWRAHLLALEGKQEEAHQLFQELKSQATTPDDKVFIHAIQLRSNDKTRRENDRLLKLEALDESLKNTAEYHYCVGVLETSPRKQLDHLNQCLAMKGREDTRRLAYLRVAQLKHALGQHSAAERALLDGMLGEDRLLGVQCSLELEKQLPEKLPLSKLAALIAGMCAHVTDETLDRLNLLCISNNWNALGAFLAKKHDTVFDNGTSANNLGRLLDILNLPSLGYEAYSKAVEQGTSVAKANVARLVGENAVPLVGLKVLESHSGTFDAATPNYPHEVRAKLEQQVHQERKRLEQLEEHGQRLFQMLTLLVEKGLASKSSKLVNGSKFHMRATAKDGQWREFEFECTVDSSGKIILSSQGNSTAVELTPLFLGRGVFAATLQQQTKGFVALTPEGNLEGSRLDLESTSGSLEWFELTRIEAGPTVQPGVTVHASGLTEG